MKLLYVCCSVLLMTVTFGNSEAVPVEQAVPDGAMVVMEDPMQDQQPLTLEDMVAVNDPAEMELDEVTREKRHHRYGGYGGYGGYRGGYGGYGGYGYGGYRGGYGYGGGHRGGYGGYRRGGYY